MSSLPSSPLPLITVLLPVYNAELYLKESLESLCAQTYPHFEVLIFDDASSDRSYEIANAYKDPRFKLQRSLKNQGYAVYLNQGIHEARGQYIARMDADDRSHPERFERQVRFLEAHPSVGICGTGYEVFGSSEKKAFQKPRDNDEIRWALMLDNPFQHPTVMIRRSILIDHSLRYDETLMPTEDYELWSRLLDVTEGANLSEILLSYRTHSNQESSARRDRQLKIHHQVSERLMNRFYLDSPRPPAAWIHWAIRLQMNTLQKKETTVTDLLRYGNFVDRYLNRFPEGKNRLRAQEQKRLLKLLPTGTISWAVALGWMLRRPKLIPALIKRMIYFYRRN